MASDSLVREVILLMGNYYAFNPFLYLKNKQTNKKTVKKKNKRLHHSVVLGQDQVFWFFFQLFSFLLKSSLDIESVPEAQLFPDLGDT